MNALELADSVVDGVWDTVCRVLDWVGLGSGLGTGREGNGLGLCPVPVTTIRNRPTGKPSRRLKSE